MKAILNSEARTKTTTTIGTSEITPADPSSWACRRLGPPGDDRYVDRVEQRRDDRLAGPPAQLAVGLEDHPVGERADRERLDVVGQHVVAAAHGRERLCRAEERQ